MLAPMDLIQEPEMPIGIVRSKSVEAPQHLFQIVGYVHDVVDSITDLRFARNLIGVGRAIIAKGWKALANLRIPNTIFGRRLLVTLVRITERCVVVT